MKQVNIHEAKTQLSKLVEKAGAGEEIVIARAGRPVARLVPLNKPAKRVPGRLKGKIKVTDELMKPLPDDVVALFEGRFDE